jgi:hypothetical protein
LIVAGEALADADQKAYPLETTVVSAPVNLRQTIARDVYMGL